MATDWAADVKKYAAGADDAIIAGIVRYCGIALSKPDSALVAFSDPKELAPPNLRNSLQTVILKGEMSADAGKTESGSARRAAARRPRRPRAPAAGAKFIGTILSSVQRPGDRAGTVRTAL